MKPMVEELESRNCPAPLLAITAAQLASLHDAAGLDGEADIGQAVSLPVADAVLVTPLPTTNHWFVSGFNNLAIVVRNGILEDAHYGVDEAMAQSLADSLNVPLLSPVPTLDTPGTLTATPELVDLLTTAEPGQPMQPDWLAAQLGADPLALAPPGEPLQLAVAVEGGYRVHTLAQDGGLWVMGESVFAETLTPGIWQLTATE